MKDFSKENENNPVETQIEELLKLLPHWPIPIPIIPYVSGLYEWSPIWVPIPIPQPIPQPEPLPNKSFKSGWLPIFTKEELRLDVDGRYPQMVASGTFYGFFQKVHWIADLIETNGGWKGNIWYKDGNVSIFPYTNVEIKVTYSKWWLNPKSATVIFSGEGNKKVRTFNFKSHYFRNVDFEFDTVIGENPTLSINTCAHPNRPPNLLCEDLTVQEVFQRAGFNVTTSPGGTVPISGAGTNELWSDMEMHDAMQTFWSKFANKPQWAMWIFTASLHDMGNGLGGIMFDDIGPNHRQGCAIFNDSFISDPPVGETHPNEWVERMLFWTTCHEMGHCFNLAHSWQKTLGTSWIPLVDEPEARSFMNYPYRVNGDEPAFFSDFEHRFSDQELLFMRHAPFQFVQMGNADWFDNHGFEGANISEFPSFKLELRVNREKAIFEYMEPVILELKLSNISSQVQLVDNHILTTSETKIVIIKKDDKPARRLIPYAHYCFKSSKMALDPNTSIYESIFISAGINGWDIAEPGNYMIQVALHIGNEDIISNPLQVYIMPPNTYEEESLSKSFFTNEVGRILAFNGSRFFTRGNETLQVISKKLKDQRIAIHANYILGNEIARDYKQLIDDQKHPFVFKKIPAQPREAWKFFDKALIDQSSIAIETFGHIEFKKHIDNYSSLLEESREMDNAFNTQQNLYDTMSKREVHGRKIISSVLEEIKNRRDSFKPKK